MNLRHLLILIAIANVWSCKPDHPSIISEQEGCSFPVPEPASRFSVEGGYKDEVSGSGEIGVDVDLAPYFKKLAGLNINAKAGGKQVTRAYERIIREYEDDNPAFTQKAWLYWSVAYGLYTRACQDTVSSPKEIEKRKDKIIEVYNSHLLRIEQSSRAIPQPTTETNTPPIEEPSMTRPPKQLEKNYLSSNTPVQVAVLSTGDKSYRNFGDFLGNWLQYNGGFSVNTGLFLPPFFGDFGPRIRNRDANSFVEAGADKVANCVCWIDQESKLKESSLAEESFITAILSARLTIFNLKKGTQSSFTLNERGAGITINRAMESLEEKLKIQLSDLTQTLNACR